MCRINRIQWSKPRFCCLCCWTTRKRARPWLGEIKGGSLLLFYFLNERAQIVRISINREGETSESHGRLFKTTKKEKKWQSKNYTRCGHPPTTRLRWDQLGAELPQFPTPAPPPWFCWGVVPSSILDGWKFLHFSPSRYPSWPAGGGIWAPLAGRPQGSPWHATST